MLHTVERYEGETTGRYIVTFKSGFNKSSLRITGITHSWDGVLNGIAGHFDEATVRAFRADPKVKSISEDGVMHTMVTQTNAPWGLSRLSSTTRLSSQDPTALTFPYTYDTPASSDVDIYIVDTGVLTSHSQFGGRARWGSTFGGYPDADGNGHGTHCAGTAASNQFGVAKSANIIAVKALHDSGYGDVSDIVSGLNWVYNQHASTGRPTVVSMSFGGSASSALDDAVAALTNVGIHVVAAAGNSNTDASGTSPARVPSAVTVGATTIADARASYSNFGSAVDVFAPGDNVISTWIGSATATNTLSGTSMSTAHVAGLVAYFISLEGNISPAAMSDKVKSLSVKDVLSGIPFDTNNYLAHNA